MVRILALFTHVVAVECARSSVHVVEPELAVDDLAVDDLAGDDAEFDYEAADALDWDEELAEGEFNFLEMNETIAGTSDETDVAEEGDEQSVCPIGRRVRNPFGGRCAMVLSGGGRNRRCQIQYEDGTRDEVHPMHLREDNRCPQRFQPQFQPAYNNWNNNQFPQQGGFNSGFNGGFDGGFNGGFNGGGFSEFVVADGCRRNQGRQSARNRNAFTGRSSVRCCSFDGRRCESRTVGCLQGVSHSQATAACSSRGLRLCSQQELNRGVCCATGCGFDGRRVWTNTPAR